MSKNIFDRGGCVCCRVDERTWGGQGMQQGGFHKGPGSGVW